MKAVWENGDAIRVLNIKPLGKICGLTWKWKRPDKIVLSVGEMFEILNHDKDEGKGERYFMNALIPAVRDGGCVQVTPFAFELKIPNGWKIIKQTEDDFIAVRNEDGN